MNKSVNCMVSVLHAGNDLLHPAEGGGGGGLGSNRGAKESDLWHGMKVTC